MTEVDDTEMRIDLFRNEVRQSTETPGPESGTHAYKHARTAHHHVNNNTHITIHIKLLLVLSQKKTQPHHTRAVAKDRLHVPLRRRMKPRALLPRK